MGIDKTYVSDQESVYLIDALSRLLQRVRLDESMKNDDAEKTLSHILHQKPASIAERTGVIFSMLQEKKKLRFLEIMYSCRSKSEIIASFMAILSLISSQRVVTEYAEDDAFNPNVCLVEGAEPPAQAFTDEE